MARARSQASSAGRSAGPGAAPLAVPDAPAAQAGSPVPHARKLRVLIAAHSHPELSNGGGEIAAFELFRG